MRILFTFIGGLGHFYPLLPVARAAQAARHEVAVACSGGLVDRVEASGFRALATSTAPPPAARSRDLTPLAPVDARAAEVEFAENFADRGARRHATAVQECIAAWGPDLVVRDEADLGSALAAEVRGIPTATVLVLASGLLIRPELVGPPLATLRAEHGLPPDPDLSLLTRGVVLSPFPPSFRSPRSPVRLPASTSYFRSEASPAVPGATARPPRRQVYATLGTVFSTGSGDLLERLVEGLAEVEADVLLTVGHHVDPADLGPRPAHVRVERFVPQAEVLATADLVVSHGGSGSLVAALAHGLPSVLLPLGADQPHNAARAEELGLARVLDAATATPEEIRRGVEEALQDDEARVRARRVADEIAALAGVEAVLPVLERHAASAP